MRSQQGADSIAIEELSDGNINYVFRCRVTRRSPTTTKTDEVIDEVSSSLDESSECVQGIGRPASVIVKIAPPHLRIDASWRLRPDRIAMEAEWLQLVHSFFPSPPPPLRSSSSSSAPFSSPIWFQGKVLPWQDTEYIWSEDDLARSLCPLIYSFSSSDYAIIMEDLAPAHVLRTLLNDVENDIHLQLSGIVLGRTLGSFIGQYYLSSCSSTPGDEATNGDKDGRDGGELGDNEEKDGRDGGASRSGRQVGMEAERRGEMLSHFARNWELIQLTSNVIFTFPFIPSECNEECGLASSSSSPSQSSSSSSPSQSSSFPTSSSPLTNNISSSCSARHEEHPSNAWSRKRPHLREMIYSLRANMARMNRIRLLKWRFLNVHEVLLHGDLHTGSIMLQHPDRCCHDADADHSEMNGVRG